MKVLTTVLLLVLSTALTAEAQFREDLPGGNEYSATVSHTQNSSPGNWMNLLNMTMSHSYSMSFTSFGGQAQNLNAYTNSMFFDLSEKFDAQVDVSVLHSPFGNSFMTNNDLGARIVLDQARLDFKPSENTRISLQVSQYPYSYGHNPFSMGYYDSPFDRRRSHRY